MSNFLAALYTLGDTMPHAPRPTRRVGQIFAKCPQGKGLDTSLAFKCVHASTLKGQQPHLVMQIIR